MSKLIDLTGLVFGEWTVLNKVDKKGGTKWLCECSCGNKKEVFGQNLRRLKTKSCGCYEKKIKTTHGQSETRLYRIWSGMIQRSTNKNMHNYERYGGRGVTVCEEWLDFNAFYNWAINNGYESKLSIDRIDNDKGYFPENCRWSERGLQNYNQTLRKQKSGFTGVYHVWNDTWQARIHVEGKQINLGTFKSKKEAVEKRLEAEMKYYGEYSTKSIDSIYWLFAKPVEVTE